MQATHANVADIGDIVNKLLASNRFIMYMYGRHM